ncbi:DinB family protein [Streptomyces lunaelactis]|uniref:DinB family protein n=1 Tax=Streptomyces lunaelactis TaxID=1535768 RepID=UPI001584DD34|nr:DinB family protein [Streptomyces lunaelactis]NUK01806.1 DinB family protein [Streptomyces lunaelactis]NUK09557.1 DinB family protein [Streptomyces lunaelactis]NUK14958.1 DinB family protein [Streptomyces lunaelactis]NUK24509.1 DinB family protein [Streptomyces lunaelactis]NUK35233.1 DinB family protein [Streptomyces lunaelactis]
MTTPERTEPSTTAGERDMLEGWLEYHRETLEMKCAGLGDEQLRQLSVPPSEISLLGLVRHMAEVERSWFRKILAGESVEWIYSSEDKDGDFHVSEQDTYAEAYATWQAEIVRARELAAAHGLDDVAQSKHPRTGEVFNLRWIMTHMIEEYARHNGHADLIRERIDGATGE